MAWAFLGLLVLVVAVFGDAVFTHAVFYQRDIHSYWYPHIEIFGRAVAEGSWPLWNPCVGFGRPLLADPKFQLAYPPTWLNLLLPPAVYYKLFLRCSLLDGRQVPAREEGDALPR